MSAGEVPSGEQQLPRFEPPKTQAEIRFSSFVDTAVALIRTKAQGVAEISPTFPPPIIVCNDDVLTTVMDPLHAHPGPRRHKQGTLDMSVYGGGYMPALDVIYIAESAVTKLFGSTNPYDEFEGQFTVMEELLHAATRFVSPDGNQIRVGFSTFDSPATPSNLAPGNYRFNQKTPELLYSLGLASPQSRPPIHAGDPAEIRDPAILTERATNLLWCMLAPEFNSGFSSTLDLERNVHFFDPENGVDPERVVEINSGVIKRLLIALTTGNKNALNVEPKDILTGQTIKLLQTLPRYKHMANGRKQRPTR